MSTRHTRQLFICAALFNLLAGLPLLLVPGPAAELLGLSLNPTALLFIHIAMGLVVLFGGVYWLIARDPVRYRPFISLGVVLKTLVVVVILSHWLAGTINGRLPALAAGDLIFALLFWGYLRSTTGLQPAGESGAT